MNAILIGCALIMNNILIKKSMIKCYQHSTKTLMIYSLLLSLFAWIGHFCFRAHSSGRHSNLIASLIMF